MNDPLKACQKAATEIREARAILAPLRSRGGTYADLDDHLQIALASLETAERTLKEVCNAAP